MDRQMKSSGRAVLACLVALAIVATACAAVAANRTDEVRALRKQNEVLLYRLESMERFQRAWMKYTNEHTFREGKVKP